MAANYVLESVTEASQSREVIFAGDNVRLAGQIDYPTSAPPRSGYPIIFVIHHAGGNTRADFEHYAHVGLECGFAVFRWDKRGTGRSGAGGRGSTLQDAVNAYKVALNQPGIDRNKAIILAQGEGTLMLSDIFNALTQHGTPYATLLIANLLDRHDILALDTRVRIIIGAEDWISWRVYGKAACDAHNAKYNRDANFSVAHHADRLLIDTRYPDHRIHIGAKHIIKDWLLSLG
jgi:alpha-beta hydrolase superfamily lysophospholipase